MRRRRLCILAAAVVGALAVPLVAQPASASVSSEVVFRRIVSPVVGRFGYGNDWGDPRSGGRRHQGNDLMGRKMQVLVAAADATVGWSRTDGNNMVSITDADGWRYVYIHINNDTPGTDDGLNPAESVLFPGIVPGATVTAGQPIAYMGDSGNAEGTSPHLHFEIHKPDGAAVNPYWSLMLSQGRRVLDRCAFDANPDREPSIDPGSGYWAVSADGGVFTYGAARYLGSMGGIELSSPVVAIEATPSGAGYWELASDGGVFSFGDAGFFGSTGGLRLASPVNGIAASPTGNGYWLLAEDGGVFTFGDAGFHGSASGRAAGGIVDLVPTMTGAGYWVLGERGSVFGFGDAEWKGGADALGYCTSPEAVAMAPSPTGGGYWIQAADGNVFNFGDARDHGSFSRQGLRSKPRVALAAVPPAVPIAPGPLH